MITKGFLSSVPLGKDLLLSWSKINNTAVTQPGSPSTGHIPPSRTLAATTCGKSLDDGAIFASQKYFLSALALCDCSSWHRESFSLPARFLSDLLQPSFNSGSETNPQNYLSNCSFWPRECGPVSCEGLHQRPCCSLSWCPSGDTLLPTTSPSPTPALGTTGGL